MSTLDILVTLNIVIICMTTLVSGFAIYSFRKSRQYLNRLVNYHSGLTDIQATLKAALLEHHAVMEQLFIDNTDEILKHITYTNRWQKVMAKMIKIGDATPFKIATGSETVKEAEELHEIGLDIAKVAFEDKNDIEEKVVKEENPS